MPIVEFVVRTEAPDFPPDELLIETDGVPLESDWHRIEINLLIELMHQFLPGRDDFFAGGNMFLYFSEEQARNKNYRGPDFFFVWGASPMPPRPYWAIWKEGCRFPNVIIELLSPSTAKMDRTTKKDLYEQTFRTPEYFCYEPDTKTLEGWRLGTRKYRPIEANDKGWLWSEQLELWLGLWDGPHMQRDMTWLRFFTRDGELVPTLDESGEGQRLRAEVAEAELARMKTQLKQQKD